MEPATGRGGSGRGGGGGGGGDGDGGGGGGRGRYGLYFMIDEWFGLLQLLIVSHTWINGELIEMLEM